MIRRTLKGGPVAVVSGGASWNAAPVLVHGEVGRA
jgi:hypothetical protein